MGALSVAIVTVWLGTLIYTASTTRNRLVLGGMWLGAMWVIAGWPAPF